MKEKALLWRMQTAAVHFLYCKRKVKEYYTDKWKTAIKICDILMICCILFNFGAIMITNALVVKEDPAKKFHEVNPTVREDFEFAKPPEKVIDGRDINILWKAMIIHGLKLMFLIMMYVYLRFNINSDYTAYLMMIHIAFLFILLGYDFSNDLGYWIGVQIWGAK